MTLTQLRVFFTRRISLFLRTLPPFYSSSIKVTKVLNQAFNVPGLAWYNAGKYGPKEILMFFCKVFL